MNDIKEHFKDFTVYKIFGELVTYGFDIDCSDSYCVVRKDDYDYDIISVEDFYIEATTEPFHEDDSPLIPSIENWETMNGFYRRKEFEYGDHSETIAEHYELTGARYITHLIDICFNKDTAVKIVEELNRHSKYSNVYYTTEGRSNQDFIMLRNYFKE